MYAELDLIFNSSMYLLVLGTSFSLLFVPRPETLIIHESPTGRYVGHMDTSLGR